MKKIAMIHGKFALVNDADYEELNAFIWHAIKGHTTLYVCRSGTVNGKYTTIYLHAQILGIIGRGIHVDHIDHDGLNNQRYNLRISDNWRNNRNRKSVTGSTSRFVGVCRTQDDKAWCAYIQINGMPTYLGRFQSEIEAAAIRDEAAKKHYGEFAHLNLK